MEERYLWDPRKATANRRDHGIAFEEVGAAFRDPFAVEWIDDREDYGEERVNMLAMCGGILLHVTYTNRHGCRPMVGLPASGGRPPPRRRGGNRR